MNVIKFVSMVCLYLIVSLAFISAASATVPNPDDPLGNWCMVGQRVTMTTKGSTTGTVVVSEVNTCGFKRLSKCNAAILSQQGLGGAIFYQTVPHNTRVIAACEKLD